MSSISIDDREKEWFDDWRDDDQTHSEAFSEMVDIVRAFEGEPVDVEALADELEASLVSKIEVAAYRGVADYMDTNHE